MNWQAVAAAALATGIIGYVLRWASKGHDARASAENALIGMPGPIIATQNTRIAALELHTTTLWADLQKAHQENRECHEKLAVATARGERQTFLIENLSARITDLENRVKSQDRQ